MYFTLPWLISISPMFKWHIYESTSMTFTFLIFLFGIYFAINLDKLNQKSYFFSRIVIFIPQISSTNYGFHFNFCIVDEEVKFKFYE